MTDQPATSKSRVSTANVKQKSKGFSPVWVIPIVAALVGGWMVFQNLIEENAKIEVTFKSAAGIEAGKTLLKVRDIVVGKVTAVEFTKDLGVIKVAMEFEGIGPEHITDKTRFWVVKPRIGAGGVSGMDTLLSGAYIEADPGEGGEPAVKFTGMEEPGVYQLGNPGTSYRLEASTLGSLSRGSPIKYRDVAVGQVTRYKLAEDSVSVDIEIFIRAPYDKLVKKDTRFWNISGLDVEAGAEGFKLQMASIATLISGGVAFSDVDSSSGAQAEANSVFTLYQHEDEQEVAEEVAFYVPAKLYFRNGVNGLVAGAPLEYKGLRLGTVEKVTAELNEDKTDMTTIAAVRIEPDRLPEESNSRGESREFRTKLVGDVQYMSEQLNLVLREQIWKSCHALGISQVPLLQMEASIQQRWLLQAKKVEEQLHDELAAFYFYSFRSVENTELEVISRLSSELHPWVDTAKESIRGYFANIRAQLLDYPLQSSSRSIDGPFPATRPWLQAPSQGLLPP